jgi:hypothetical protein
MNTEDPETMRALDDRLRKLCGGLDARPGFDDRLQARIAELSAVRSAQSTAADRSRIEAQHERALAVARSAARVDAIAVGIAGLGGALALWRFAPQLSAWYAASVGTLDPMFLGFGSLAVTTVALWTLLRRFDVDPRSLVGA